MAKLVILITISLQVLFLSSCAKDSVSFGDDSLVPLNLNRVTVESSIAADGGAEVAFSLSGDLSSFQIALESQGRNLAIERVIGPGGIVLLDSARASDVLALGAGQLKRELVVVNLPGVAEMAMTKLPQGRYQCIVRTVAISQNTPASPLLTGVVTIKDDDDETRTVLPVRMYLSEVLFNSKAARDGITNSLVVTDEILSRAEISLNVEFVREPRLLESIENAAVGDELYREILGGDHDFIPIWFASTVRNLSSPLNPLAQAGSIPGTFSANRRSGISASFNAAGGSDRVIDSEQDREDEQRTSEARLLGEALAHELLHYIGLRDTVTFSNDSATSSDGLDSPKCPSTSACRLDENAPQNIMFPFPLDRIRGQESSSFTQDQFIPRQFMSTMQMLVAQRGVGAQ